MTKKIDFSLIIINYNSALDLIKAVNSFIDWHQKNQKNYEIIVIDNHSTLTDYQILEQYCQKLNFKKNQDCVLKRLSHNLGFGQANNQAVSLARGEYLLFLNPDTKCTQTLLDDFYLALQNRKIAFVAPQLILPNGEKQLYAYGAFPSILSLLKNKLGWVKNRPRNDEKNFKVDWLSGACFAGKKDVFELLGGFSSLYFMYYEDIDLCRHAYQQQLECQILPRLTLIHYGGERKRLSQSRRQAYFKAQNQYFKQWQPLSFFFLWLMRLPYQLICYFLDQP